MDAGLHVVGAVRRWRGGGERQDGSGQTAPGQSSIAPTAGKTGCYPKSSSSRRRARSGLLRRSGLRPAGELRGAQSTAGEVRNSPFRQRQRGARDRKVVDLREGRATSPGFITTVFSNKAASWTKARGVMAKLEFHFGELFPRVASS